MMTFLTKKKKKISLRSRILRSVIDFLGSLFLIMAKYACKKNGNIYVITVSVIFEYDFFVFIQYKTFVDLNILLLSFIIRIYIITIFYIYMA